VSVALVAFVLAAVPAAAQSPSLAVAPNTELLAGQTVQISGAATPGTPIGVVGVCHAATDFTSLSTAQLTCELITFFVGDESFDFEWTVTRVIETPGGPIDCLATPCVTAFGGVDGSSVLFLEIVPLSFAAAPLVQFLPTSIGHLEPVSLAVTGTPVIDSVVMIQCVEELPIAADNPPGACVEHGPAVPYVGGHVGHIAASHVGSTIRLRIPWTAPHSRPGACSAHA
jgi:hypothetical protein